MDTGKRNGSNWKCNFYRSFTVLLAISQETEEGALSIPSRILISISQYRGWLKESFEEINLVLVLP